jgi:hypothetical protein
LEEEVRPPHPPKEGFRAAVGVWGDAFEIVTEGFCL